MGKYRPREMHSSVRTYTRVIVLHLFANSHTLQEPRRKLRGIVSRNVGAGVCTLVKGIREVTRGKIELEYHDSGCSIDS